MTMTPLKIGEFLLFKSFLDRAAQEQLRDQTRNIAIEAPLTRYNTPGGRPMRVRMTAAGNVGWVSDAQGYRYAPTHPSGMPWPPIPEELLDIWKKVAGHAVQPDTCLINYYDGDAKMGLHQDRDEADLTAPVVSISLGDTALFRIGGKDRGGPTQTVLLESGDVLVMGGAARLCFHGVDGIRHKSSTLLKNGGRINLTLRKAT